MSVHSWCRDVQRDEAVRAAEDGRSGPLPTLEEAISRAGQFATPEAPQEQKCTERESGLLTERVTLEVTHDSQSPLSTWAWHIILGWPPSVRVVEEAHFDDLAQVAMERDAAIRERDEAKQRADRDAVKCIALADKVIGLKARVAELESAAKAAPAANADGGSNHAPAASGAAGTEPLAWGRRSKATGKITFVTAEPPVCHWSHEDIVPLYAAPQPASGWLTAEERRLIEGMMESASAFPPTMHWHSGCSVRETLRVMESLLARSSPPEVVLPGDCGGESYDSFVAGWRNYRDEALKALATAGVKWKELGRE